MVSAPMVYQTTLVKLIRGPISMAPDGSVDFAIRIFIAGVHVQIEIQVR